MSGAPRGNQDDLLDFSFDPTGSCLPPPLRPPALSQAQLQAAIELGFSNKYLPSGGPSRNGKDALHRQASSEFDPYSSSESDNNSGQFRPSDQQQQQFLSGDFVDGQGNYPREQEGLLPPLRRPHINEIPPDVLAVLLKNSRFEEILAPHQTQDSQQNPQGRGSPSEATRMSMRNDNNHNQYPQSPQSQSHPQHQMSQQQQQQNRQGMSPNSVNSPYQQNSPRVQDSSNNKSPYPSSSPASGAGASPGQKKIGLSPFAKEFRPSAPAPMPPMTEWMNPQDTEIADMAEAIAHLQFLQNQTPQPGQEQENYNDFNNMGGSGGGGGGSFQGGQHDYPEDNSDFVLSTVTDAIMDLTNHPANFSRCAKSVTDILKAHLKDLETFGVVVTLLVEQSISNPNFCYSGARLSQTLHKNNITVDKVTFKKLLLQRCQEEFGNCIAHIQDPNIQMRCRGLLMFFGELFVNLRIEKSAGVSSPIIVIGLGVLEIMQLLVKDPVHDNIKCVFQVLKLVGWELEGSTDAKIKANFEQLMKDLSYLCMANSNIKPQTKLLLDSLFQIKNKKWNREEEEEKTVSSPASSTFSSTPSNNFYELPDSDDDDFGEDDCILLDDEPEEVQRAYEDFLKAAK